MNRRIVLDYEVPSYGMQNVALENAVVQSKTIKDIIAYLHSI